MTDRTKRNLPNGSWANWGIGAIAAGACLGAILRVVSPNEDIQKRLDEKTLLYIGASGVLLLLRDTKNIAFGDWKVEFFEKKLEEVKTAAEEAKTTAAVATTAAAVAIDEAKYGLVKRVAAPPPIPLPFAEIQPGSYPDDPWKGQFGGKNHNEYRKLTATVIPADTKGEWFYVTLRVQSTDPGHHPLKGAVQFYLHPSFRESKPVVPVINEQAELNLRAWGAFTVGAITEEQTTLELDLAELKNPELAIFVSR